MRFFSFFFQNDTLLTGGERGVLSMWKSGEEQSVAVKSSMKVSNPFLEKKTMWHWISLNLLRFFLSGSVEKIFIKE